MERKPKYSETSLAEALREVRNKTMGVRAASRAFGVPVTTLHDKIKGKTMDKIQKPGPPSVLTVVEELKIVEWLTNIAKCGFPQKPNELLDVVQKIIKDEKRKTPFKNDRPGKKWYYAFLNRNKGLLTLRTPETISKARAVVKEETIRKWFRDLEAHLTDENCQDILNDPTRLFNGDETSFSLAPKTGNVIGPRGYRNIFQIKFSNEKENITVLLVFSASGETLPPVVVFPYQKVPQKIVNSMPDDWVIGRSETGWMRTETFFEYIANDFSNWLNQHQIKRPVLLLVDGHKSHLSMHLSEFCSNNQIILYSLPPNTTHIMQPADVGAFKGIKSDYQKTVREWSVLPENHGRTITKTNFCQILKLVLEKTDRTSTIINAFRKCGLFPFDPDAIDYSKCVHNNLEKLNETANENEAISVNEIETTKKVLLSVKKQIIENGIDFEILIETLTTLAHKKSEMENNTENLSILQTETILEEAALIAEANEVLGTTNNILENVNISEADIEIVDNFELMFTASSINEELGNILVPPQTNIDNLEEKVLEEAMETILNTDMITTNLLPCATSTPCSSPSTSFS